VVAAATYNAIDKLLVDVVDALEAIGAPAIGPILPETLVYRLRSRSAPPVQDPRIRDVNREGKDGKSLFTVLEVAALVDRRDSVADALIRTAKASDPEGELATLMTDGLVTPDEVTVLERILGTALGAGLTADDVTDAVGATRRHVVVGATMGQLYQLVALKGPAWRGARWFQVVMVDEASQMRVSDAMTHFCTLREGWQVIVAGDHRQLGPVRQVAQENTRQGLLESVFSYMQERHGLSPLQLVRNYRTNEEIAAWPRNRFYGGRYIAHSPDRRLVLASAIPATAQAPDGWPPDLPWSRELAMLLDPNSPIVVVTYGAKQHTLSNPFEAQIVAALAAVLRRHLPRDDGLTELDALRWFWKEQVAVVTPHRAQMSDIANRLVSSGAFPRRPRPQVDTVDAVQGQERDVVLASYSVSDPDFIASEEAFILDPRRFNVTLTRARSKFVILASDSLVEHLPYEKKVAEQAAQFQLFVERYCRLVASTTLPYYEDGTLRDMPVRVRCVGAGVTTASSNRVAGE
jgi:hypothetical protein